MGMKNGVIKHEEPPIAGESTETTRLLDFTELLKEYPTRAELASLKSQVQTMQTTIDRHQDINKDLLDENNQKIDNVQKDMGDIKIKYFQIDIILKRITDTFTHMGVLFTQQQKEIGYTVQDSIEKAIQPVQEKVNMLTNGKISKPQVKIEKEKSWWNPFSYF